MESQLDLAWAEPVACAGAENRDSICRTRVVDTASQESAEPEIEEDSLFSRTLGSDGDGSRSEVQVTSIQSNERAEPDAGAKEHREHCVVSSSGRAVRFGDGLEQSLRFVLR